MGVACDAVGRRHAIRSSRAGSAIRGKKAFAPIVLHSLDAVQVAGKVLEVARQFAIRGELPLIRVDVIGVGAGVADFLRYNNQVECVGVNVANAATIEEYALLRDQLWFGLQKWLKDGGTIPSDPKLEAELMAPTYAFDVRGRIKVEPKEKIKERGRPPGHRKRDWREMRGIWTL